MAVMSVVGGGCNPHKVVSNLWQYSPLGVTALTGESSGRKYQEFDFRELCQINFLFMEFIPRTKICLRSFLSFFQFDPIRRALRGSHRVTSLGYFMLRNVSWEGSQCFIRNYTGMRIRSCLTFSSLHTREMLNCRHIQFSATFSLLLLCFSNEMGNLAPPQSVSIMAPIKAENNLRLPRACFIACIHSALPVSGRWWPGLTRSQPPLSSLQSAHGNH